MARRQLSHSNGRESGGLEVSACSSRSTIQVMLAYYGDKSLYFWYCLMIILLLSVSNNDLWMDKLLNEVSIL